MTTTLSDTNSAKFRFWSFVSMLLLVFVHSYNLNIRFLHPWTLPGEPLTLTAFTEYLLANGLLRFRIPMLFMISGFLFALHDTAPHGTRIMKRMRTLLLPYVLWSGFALLVAMLFEQSPSGRSIIASTNLLRLDETRALLSDHTLPEILARLTVATPAYQLWFIRSLFFYNLLYPFLRTAVSHPVGQKFFFGFAFLLWLSSGGFFFIEGEGLLFFSLGVWVQKHGFDIDRRAPLMPAMWWGTIFVAVAVIKTLLAFHVPFYIGMALEPVLLLLHKIVVASGLIAAWYAGSAFAVRWMQRRWFAQASAFSFVIYAAHAPLVAFAVEAWLRTASDLPYFRIIGFVLVPLLLILGSIGFGAAMRRWVPSVYGVMTGGRGMM